MARKPVISFGSGKTSIVRIDSSTPCSVYEVTGTYCANVTNPTRVLTCSPVKYPRQRSVTVSSSLELYSSMRYRNLRQRKYLDATLISTASQSTTQKRIGLGSQAFVVLPISSSRHEVQVLKTYYSGAAVIPSAVPYTGSLFYVKSSPIKKTTWKWVASASMGGFTADRGQLIDASASIHSPHAISVEAPAGSDNGRIIDVRVWVEILQVSGSGMHPALAQFGISVRNPLLGWGHAHPMRNYTGGIVVNPALGTGIDVYWASSGSIPDFYRDSFLLWEGSSLFRTPTSTEAYRYTAPRRDIAYYCPTWDRDFGMRTIFCDGASTRNPRDILQVYRGEFRSVMTGSFALGSPNGGTASYDSVNNPTSTPMLGLGVPWFNDPDYSGSFTDAGSPPAGWLNGAGGSALPDEWPTTGSNNGTATIRPIYPLLDDIYCKVLGQEYPDSNITSLIFNEQDWIGRRPGLRGKPMGTRWEVLIAQGNLGGVVSAVPTYVRQVRIEFTYELCPASASPRLTQKRSRRRSSTVLGRSGPVMVGVVSGSTSTANGLYPRLFDRGANGVYVDVGYEAENNRSVGYAFDTSSLSTNNFAVYTASVEISNNTASYDKSRVLSVLEPSLTQGIGANTLATFVRTMHPLETREQQATRVLSGTT